MHIDGDKDLSNITIYRAKLQEQNALSEEIVDAMNSISLGQPVDEQDLEDELEALQQEQLDQKMLETGTVPVDQIQRLPAAANGERKLLDSLESARLHVVLTEFTVKGKAPAIEEDDEEEELRKLQAEMMPNM